VVKVTRLVATADLHGHLPEIPACDILLIAGDVCPTSSHNRKFQADWLRSEFAEWMVETPAEEIVWIGGNHDFVLEDMARQKIDALPGYYLRDESVKVDGLVIHGAPWSPQFGNWAFMRPDPALSEKWDKIPEDVDILMVHGPFHGQLDGVPGYLLQYIQDDVGKMRPTYVVDFDAEPEHVGSVTLRNRLNYSNYPSLKLFVCGHIHEGYGEGGVIGKNTFKSYNVSHMDGRYNPVNPPVVIDL